MILNPLKATEILVLWSKKLTEAVISGHFLVMWLQQKYLLTPHQFILFFCKTEILDLIPKPAKANKHHTQNHCSFCSPSTQRSSLVPTAVLHSVVSPVRYSGEKKIPRILYKSICWERWASWLLWNKASRWLSGWSVLFPSAALWRRGCSRADTVDGALDLFLKETSVG